MNFEELINFILLGLANIASDVLDHFLVEEILRGSFLSSFNKFLFNNFPFVEMHVDLHEEIFEHLFHLLKKELLFTFRIEDLDVQESMKVVKNLKKKANLFFILFVDLFWDIFNALSPEGNLPHPRVELSFIVHPEPLKKVAKQMRPVSQQCLMRPE